MIALIGNRPVLQIGRHQVIDYGGDWIETALQRAARAADGGDFPFAGEVRAGVMRYLETRCSLRLLPIDELYGRLRQMLESIGCQRIAAHLEPLAPPLTVSLERAAREAGNGFELGFFSSLRAELAELRAAGAEELRFVGLRESAMLLRGAADWDAACEGLLGEIESFLRAWGGEAGERPLRMSWDGER